jgi:hypothetical protein
MSPLRVATVDGQVLEVGGPTGGPIVLGVPSAAEPDDLAAYRLALLASVAEAVLRDQGSAVRRQAGAGAGTADLTLLLETGSESHPTGPCLAVAGLLVDGRDGEPLPELEQAQARAGTPAALRYFGLTAHYRAPWCFSWSGLAAAGCAYEALGRQAAELAGATTAGPLSSAGQALQERFAAALATDLDTPTALGILWQVLRAPLAAGERLQLLLEFDRALGLGLAEAAKPPEEALPAEAAALIEERTAARRDRDFARSDALRAQLAALGIETQDTPQGSTYRRAGAPAGQQDGAVS